MPVIPPRHLPDRANRRLSRQRAVKSEEFLGGPRTPHTGSLKCNK